MQNRKHAPNYLKRQPRAAAEEHERINQERRLSAGKRLYGTVAWQALRTQVKREQPMCECGAKGTVVDHVKPHHGDNALFFDRRNLRTCCKKCHDRKTVMHDGGFGRESNELPLPDDAEREYFVG
jgi:5-methylcytosine-specific restriction protein A